MSDDFRKYKRHALESHLKRHLTGEVCFDAPSRKLYSTDASIYQIEPLGVVLPRTLQDVHTAVQIAVEHRTPIVPRGGGTSLSGQAIGPGLVIDCSKYLRNILEINLEAGYARVQPGVVLVQLNRELESHGFQFGPDVSTASRATLGGMIGNNSAGSRSIVYGKTIDHVRRLNVILSDGSPASFGPLSAPEWEQRASRNTMEGRLYKAVHEIVGKQEAEIRRRFPKILRRVSGYNLDAFVNEEKELASLADLLVGSEGTLGFMTEAEVTIVRRPSHRGLLVPHFDSLAAAMETLAICLEYQPSAVELLDQLILDLARVNLGLQRNMRLIQGRPATLFMVEFSSDDPVEVRDRIAKLEARLQGGLGITALVSAIEAEDREPLWDLRRAGVPLLLGLPGDRKPTTFVEDTAVAPEHLPRFVQQFREVLLKHGTDGAFYGHASVGCLHIRPVLNLKEQGDVAKMRLIMAEIADLILEYGGSLSGEHGDGLARSEWNRKMFGPEVYEAFREIKRAFDPHQLFNPGKIVDAPPMSENLRYHEEYKPVAAGTLFDYSRQEGFVRSIENCNGSGVCRKTRGGTMCPSYRATLDERDSTRGRANALRLLLADQKPLGDASGDWVHDVLDLCLMCKACKAECPSNVDLAKLKAEFLESYYQSRTRPIAHRVMGQIHVLNRWGAELAPLANLFANNPINRWLMDTFGGIDRRRSLPPLHWNHLRRWMRRHSLVAQDAQAGSRGRVLLLDDCFTTFQEPRIGIAAVQVLEHVGYRVELLGGVCCGRAMISKGMLRSARDLIHAQAEQLAARLSPDVPILGLEPSCILTMVDEWKELAPGPATRKIAASARLADDWLAERWKPASADLIPKPIRCVVHGHCHQKALIGTAGTRALLQLIPELEVEMLDAGCCGMAGSFGYEKEHYDVSVQIANLTLLPALARSPEALVVAVGTSCRHQIHDLARRSAKHPLEVIAEQLRRQG